MECIIVDAHSLACPSESDYAEKTQFSDAFESYLETLASWVEISGRVKLISNSEIEQVLHDTGSYPFWDSVSKALEYLGLTDDYEARDIVKLLDTFLNKSELLEEIVEVGEVLCTTTEIDPDEELQNRKIEFVRHFERIIGFLILDQELNKNIHESSILLSKFAKSENGKIRIVGEIIDFEDSASTSISVPFNFDRHIKTAHIPHEMMMQLDYIDLWGRKSIRKCQLAVEVFLIKNRGIDYVNIEEIRKEWSLGDNFIESLRKLDLFSDATKVEKIIRSISDALLGESLAKTHGLRSGPGANDPVRTRGKFKAVRRDIDDEFHLHYWEDGSTIKISNVVVHNDFSIF